MSISRPLGIIIGLGILGALSLPVSNLFNAPRPEVTQRLANIQDPEFRAVATLFESKCIDCHSTRARVPIYADFPVARTIIQKDMNRGIAAWNLTDKLQENGAALFSATDLSKLAFVLASKRMPPARYVALHWNAMLTSADVQTVENWIEKNRTVANSRLGVDKAFLQEPVQPLPLPDETEKNLDMTKVALGRQLFHDTRLSGDKTLSCASCHALHKGGTDRQRTSTGIKQQQGPINSPTVFNAVYNTRQFWDGRAATLEEQAAGPVANPIEMGATWEEVIARLQADTSLLKTFNHLYPDGITQNNVTNAIAEFERSLVTPNSRFDQYLRGNDGVLSKAEVHGYQLFKAHCVSCHAGPAMGGQSFEKMGVKADYFMARSKQTGMALTEADNGVFNVTKNEVDKHRFKVPTLRNVAQTAPYFHDGSVTTLKEAVEKMARFQVGKTLTDVEVNDLVAFLKSLTGEYNQKPVE